LNVPALILLIVGLSAAAVLLNLHHHDRASMLAGNLHAVLQRPTIKGRDLYDLIWYLSAPDWPAHYLTLLKNALEQPGWAGPHLTPETWRAACALIQKKSPGPRAGRCGAFPPFDSRKHIADKDEPGTFAGHGLIRPGDGWRTRRLSALSSGSIGDTCRQNSPRKNRGPSADGGWKPPRLVMNPIRPTPVSATHVAYQPIAAGGRIG
jgi:hypothetical protein